MPILDLQKSLTEVGRIRLGDKGPKGEPRKLATFRFTSGDHELLKQVAKVYGGTVRPWKNGTQAYELTSEATALDVIVPPSAMAFSQWYEQWAGGGCAKRCDGEWDNRNDKPCSCNPNARDCKPHTRLSLMLAELQSVGTWRLDTLGYYAATELAGTVDLIQSMARAGTMLPARLRLDQRTSKRIGQGTRRYAVPTLDVVATVPELLAAAGAPGGAPALAAPQSAGTGMGTPSLTPVPVDELPPPPIPSVADQINTPRTRPTRTNTTAPIPSTGRRPRTATQIDSSEAAGRNEEPTGADRITTPGDPVPPAPTHDEDTINRARNVARALREVGIVDDDRMRFLDAYSDGRYTSAKDIPLDEYADVRDAIRRIGTGDLELKTSSLGEPILVNTLTGLIHTPQPPAQ